MPRILCLDLGTKRIGVARSDALGITAQRVETIQNKGKTQVINRLREIILEEEVGTIVVGLPKKMDNTIGDAGEQATRFARHLEEELGLPVVLWDERLTTAGAHQILKHASVSHKKRKEVLDQVAAQLILQTYLDYQQSKAKREKEDGSPGDT